MAPEQTTRGRGAVSTATDVYGLGTILYALLAGRAPFTGTTLVETLDMVRTQYPEPPSRLNPRVPRDLEVICRKCLEKEPGRRYASALALSEDLSRWLRGEPILARPVGAPVRAAMWCRRNPLIAAAAALALLSLVGGFAGVTWKWREADRERARAEAVVELLTHRLLAQADAELDAAGPQPDGPRPAGRHRGQRSAAGSTASPTSRPRSARRSAGPTCRSTSSSGPRSSSAWRSSWIRRSNGPEGRTGLRATNLLATLLDRTGRSAEAEPMLRRNLADCRRVLGPDDPITLDAAERLGLGPLAPRPARRGRGRAAQERGRPRPRLQARPRRHAPLRLPAQPAAPRAPAVRRGRESWPIATPTTSSARGAPTIPTGSSR